jgi:hypothetical protein
MAESKKDPRLARAGVSGSTVVKEGVRHYTKECANCGQRHPFRSLPAAKKAETLGTFCKPCSAVRNISRYNGKVKEEFGVRLSWLRTYEVGAKSRGLLFQINAKDVRELYDEQEGLCALSGLPILLPLSSRYASVTASIDRIDNSKGYTKNNIQLVHKKVNMLRGPMSVEDFVDICKMVAEYN